MLQLLYTMDRQFLKECRLGGEYHFSLITKRPKRIRESRPIRRCERELAASPFIKLYFNSAGKGFAAPHRAQT